MGIFDFVNKYLNINKRSVQYAILSLYVFFIGVHLYNVLIEKKSIEWMQIVLQLLLIVIIHFWLYTIPKFHYRFNKLKDAFESSYYKNKFQAHLNLFYFFKKRGVFFKIIYSGIWFICCIYIVYVIQSYQLLDCGISKWITIFLLLLSLCLNYSSYYWSVQFTYFLRQVSKISTRKSDSFLEYNIYIPTSTSGIQRLLSDSTLTAVVFLVISLLYTAFYLIIILGNYNNYAFQIRVEDSPMLFRLTSILTGALGIGTFIFIFLLPRLFLKRIIAAWKRKSLKTFECKLHEAEQNQNISQIDRIVCIIERLHKDTLIFSYNSVEITVAVITCICNIICAWITLGAK